MSAFFGREDGPAIPPLVLLSQRARAQDISVQVLIYFSVEVAQRYLDDEISRDVPEKLLLLSAKFAVELADLEGETAPGNLISYLAGGICRPRFAGRRRGR
jgi:hypothetical protein